MFFLGSIDQFWVSRRCAAARPTRSKHPEERLGAEQEEAKGASGVGARARFSLIPGPACVGWRDRIPAARRAWEGNASTLTHEAENRARGLRRRMSRAAGRDPRRSRDRGRVPPGDEDESLFAWLCMASPRPSSNLASAHDAQHPPQIHEPCHDGEPETRVKHNLVRRRLWH
jgi:hypothetical protein